MLVVFLSTQRAFDGALGPTKDFRRLCSLIEASLKAILEVIAQASLVLALILNTGHLSVRLHLLCLVQALSLSLCLHRGKSLALAQRVLSDSSRDVEEMAIGVIDTMVLLMKAHSFLRELLKSG